VVENETHGYGYFQFLFIWPLRVIARLLRKFIKIKTFGDVGENAVPAVPVSADHTMLREH